MYIQNFAHILSTEGVIMKKFNSIFDLLQFPFILFLLSLKKEKQGIALVLFLSFIFIPSALHSASTTCSGTNLNITSGLNTITETSANNTNNYHKITIPSDGTISIVFTNLEGNANKKSTFFVGTTCGTINDIYNGSTELKIHTVPSFAVLSGDTFELNVASTGNNEDYKIEITFAEASNSPNISIDPTTVSVTEGTANTTLDVLLDVAGNKGSIDIGYTNNCNASTGTVTIAQGNTAGSITVDTSALAVGDCTVTLDSASGNTGQSTGTISPGTSTITITAAPSNTPNISIDPTSVSLPEGTASTTLDVLLDVAGDTGSIDIDYTNNCNSTTGTVTIAQGDTDGSITVDTSVLAAGSCTVTLTGASGNTGQNTGTISPDTSTITITAAANNPPTISGIPDQTVTVNTVFTDLNLSNYTTEVDGDDVNYTTTALPSGLTLTGSVISGTPTVIGDINVTATATDKDGSDSDVFLISVSAVPEADLNITKTAFDINGNVATSLPVDGDFQYIIDVSNSGPDDAENIVVTDVLPTGVSGISLTSTDTSLWTCTESSGTVTCNHVGNLSSGLTHSIIIDVTAPSSAATLTNEANVTSDNDPDTSNNNTSLDTYIVSTEVDNADHLCYISSALDVADCETRGNFYYGDDCTAMIMIVNLNTTSALSDVIVTKMYAPDLRSGTFTSDKGTYTGVESTLSISDFSSYTEGYIVDVGSFGTSATDMNFTITDVGSDSGNGANALTGIGIYGTYGNSGFNYSGRIYACDGSSDSGIEITTSADIIDTPITTATLAGYYNSSADTSNTGNNIKYLQTMVAADPIRAITGVHLDLDGVAMPYTPSDPTFNLVLVPYLIDYVNGSCTGNVEPVVASGTANPLLMTIGNNEYSATGNIIVSSTVRQSAKFQTIIIDPDTLSVEGQQCIMNSSTSGNFAGVAQCANSEVQYTTAFGQDAWDRCGTDSGKPCVSNNHGEANINDPTYDPDTDIIYVNDFGCYLCTFNIQPVCSTDEFAIRPEKFDLGMTHTDAPNLLRAGEDYDISLTAKDAADVIPTSYTVTDHNFIDDLDTNATRYFNDDSLDLLNVLNGEAQLNLSATAYMVNGLSSLNTSNPGTAQDVVSVTYDDVGKIDLFVYDEIWAEVDNDDTPMDCNSTNHTYICGDKNVTFIPHHFEFEELNITNRAGPTGEFTYVADNRGMPIGTPPTRSPMAARLHAKIKAVNKGGIITQNFRTEEISASYAPTLYYENPVSITPLISVPTSGTNTYLYPDANASNVVNTYIGFGRTGFDDNGTRTILWDESEFPLEFNFQREINEEANPFDVNGSYIKSITITSRYVDPDDSDIADINGSRVGDYDTATWTACASDPGCIQSNAESNATFYYARTRSSKYFYEDVTTSSVQTPIIVDIYCDLGTTCLDDYNVEIYSGLIGGVDNENWFIAMDHTNDDGNVTLMVDSPLIEGSGSPTVDGTTNGTPTDVTAWTAGIDNTVTVATGVNPTLPMTVPIKLVRESDTPTPATFSHEWLIYNPDSSISAPSPFYKVRFIGNSAWTGTGSTGDVVNIDASRKKSKRMDW